MSAGVAIFKGLTSLFEASLTVFDNAKSREIKNEYVGHVERIEAAKTRLSVAKQERFPYFSQTRVDMIEREIATLESVLDAYVVAHSQEFLREMSK